MAAQAVGRGGPVHPPHSSVSCWGQEQDHTGLEGAGEETKNYPVAGMPVGSLAHISLNLSVIRCFSTFRLHRNCWSFQMDGPPQVEWAQEPAFSTSPHDIDAAGPRPHFRNCWGQHVTVTHPAAFSETPLHLALHLSSHQFEKSDDKEKSEEGGDCCSSWKMKNLSLSGQQN